MNIAEKDKQYIWHPFTQMKGAVEPLPIQRAQGVYLYGTDGREYLDGISSWWVNIHGHGHPRICEKIAQQCARLDHVLFAGFTHEPAVLLAEELIGLLPGAFSKVFYSDDGSTAVEVALKMAVQYWHNRGVHHRKKIIALEDAYHGDTFGAMAVGARSVFTAAFHDLLFEVKRLPLPTEENIDECLRLFRQWAAEGEVAAFIFEPLVLGAAGMRMYGARNLDALLTVAKETGVLCIADEVMTGFGRTGKNFACEYLQHTPDIICLSKGITGGFLPLSVTVCTEEIFAAFYSDEQARALFHGHSYTANPIACAAGLASMELLKDPFTQAQMALLTNRHQAFAAKIGQEPFVKEARATGTILALEFETGDGTSYFHSLRHELYPWFLERGVLLRPLGNILYFMPPYCIREEEIDRVYGLIEEAVAFFAKKYYVPQPTPICSN
ncbi:adenosylmethionine--8-amino-7-oxononanoate transaminase [Paraflavisolibacter sp. H34]|uniref:adenosylmethionine--8-amino-7-oxononanoate transaminase n=1 Tax=Huijunlia imazamoxiresistens TaxID=3127457 RepID=UPI00301A1782